MNTRRRATIFVSLAMFVAAAGCNLNSRPGDRGRLLFQYYSDKDARNFDKPIIAGGHLRVYVYDIFERRRTEILEAASQTPGVARVEGAVDHLFVVHGVAPGRATFEVCARDADGEVRRDTVDLRVERTQAVQMHPKGARAFTGRVLRARDPVVGEKKLTVTTGSRIRIPWRRETAEGEPLIGYGVYPIAIEPAGAATLHDRRIQDDDFTLLTPDEPGTFEVVPADGLGGDPLVVEAVAPRDARAGAWGTGKREHVRQACDCGWGRSLLTIILIIVAVWLATALAACLLLLWIVRSPGG